MNTKYIENQYLEDYYKSYYKTRNLIAAFVIILDIVQDISLLPPPCCGQGTAKAIREEWSP